MIKQKRAWVIAIILTIIPFSSAFSDNEPDKYKLVFPDHKHCVKDNFCFKSWPKDYPRFKEDLDCFNSAYELAKNIVQKLPESEYIDRLLPQDEYQRGSVYRFKVVEDYQYIPPINILVVQVRTVSSGRATSCVPERFYWEWDLR